MAERRRRILAAAGLLALAAVASPRAQETPVGLIADRVTYDRAAGLLIAEGGVEIVYEGRILRATRLVYDETAGEVRASGPITLVDPEGGVLLADAAALTPDLAEGLVAGARVLIGDQLQLAAVEARRAEGRFVTLDRVVASSCTICAGGATPTWAIRAERVTQDDEARRIYFEDARLEVFGLPVGYAPRLSIPEPGVERASGLLAPSFLSSQIYGFGVKQPYYRVLSPAADMTLTPFVTSQGGVLLEGEYRRRFTGGGVDLGGVLAFDDGLDADIGGDGVRGVLTALGAFSLDRGFVADFDLSLVSDDDFLKQFDYSNDDLLTNTAGLRRTRARDDFRLEVIAFQSLLPETAGADVPVILPDLAYRRLLEGPVLGGRAGFDLGTLGVSRQSGARVLRLTGGLDWTRGWTLPRGVLAQVGGSLAWDGYQTWNDPETGEQSFSRTLPEAVLDLRWPLVRRDRAADHLIEPIVQVIYSEALGDEDAPNEDSQLPEFNYANLFTTNRFPGRDRLETGLRANIGLQYLRTDDAGWVLGATLGRVLRLSDLEQFPEGAGLNGRWSDYVGAVSLDLDSGFGLSNRTLLEDDLTLHRNEFAVAFETPRAGLAATYVFLARDASNPFLGIQDETSEVSIAARYRVRPNWQVRGAWRYDLTDDSNLRASGGVTYGNECAEFDLSVSRRFTSSDNLPPSTSVGFGLRLAGFGTSQEQEWPARVCVGAG